MLKIVSIAALIVGFLAAVLVFTGSLTMDRYQIIFNIISVIWFLTVPVWMVPEMFRK